MRAVSFVYRRMVAKSSEGGMKDFIEEHWKEFDVEGAWAAGLASKGSDVATCRRGVPQDLRMGLWRGRRGAPCRVDGAVQGVRGHGGQGHGGFR